MDTRSQVRQALHTGSRSGAIRKAPAIEEQFMAYWEDLFAGNDADAKSRWDMARKAVKVVIMSWVILLNTLHYSLWRPKYRVVS